MPIYLDDRESEVFSQSELLPQVFDPLTNPPSDFFESQNNPNFSSPPDPITRVPMPSVDQQIQRGIYQSYNYVPDISGFAFFENGDIEANSGKFRGRFEIGGTTITISTDDDIQENLDIIYDAGGGTLFLQNGIYILNADISTPSGVNLEGVSRDGVIIDCDGSYQVKTVGSNPYTTGTVTISGGGTTVVGSGTVWTSGMIGQKIYLGKNGDFFWYEIIACADNTHITIDQPYTGTFDLSGDTYTIATIVTNSSIKKITIQNATGAGVKQQYSMECNCSDIYVVDCGVGLDFDQCLFPLILATISGNGENVNWNEVSGYEVTFSLFSDSTSGNGFTMNSCGNATFFDSGISGNFGDGLSMTNCHLATFISMDLSFNGGKGLELVSNCDDNSFVGVGASGNTSDGYKLTATSDRNTISSASVINNGGYGINIAASTCDNNQIIAPAFENNTSGNINDQGTNTTILPNIPYLMASRNLTAGQPVGISNISGGVALAKVTSTTTTHGITTPLFTGSKVNCFAPIGGDKFVMLNYTAAGSDTLFAQIGSVDRDTMAVTLGTAASVATAFTPIGTALPACCVCKLDTDKFIIFYLADASTTNIQYRIGTVSGTTITFGTAATFFTAASTVATTNSFSCDQISTDKGIFVFKAATAANSRMVAFTVSGTVATAGTGVVPGTNSDDNVFSAVKKIATDKYVLVTQTSSTNLYAQVCTLSGTTITAGTEVKISTTAFTVDILGFNIINPSIDLFIVSWGNTNYSLVACTVSGTTPTAGTTVVANSTGTGHGIYATDSSTIYYESAAGGANPTLGKMTLSGSTLTHVGIIAQQYSTMLNATVVFGIDNGYFLVSDALNPSTNYTFWISGMSNNFVGFVASTASRNSTVGVNIRGSINSAQSGITPGATYLVNLGILTFVSNIITVDTLDDIDVGLAISSTQIMT